MALKEPSVVEAVVKNIYDVITTFSKSKLIVVGYADYSHEDFIEPLKLIDIAFKLMLMVL